MPQFTLLIDTGVTLSGSSRDVDAVHEEPEHVVECGVGILVVLLGREHVLKRDDLDVVALKIELKHAAVIGRVIGNEQVEIRIAGLVVVARGAAGIVQPIDGDNVGDATAAENDAIGESDDPGSAGKCASGVVRAGVMNVGHGHAGADQGIDKVGGRQRAGQVLGDELRASRSGKAKNRARDRARDECLWCVHGCHLLLCDESVRIAEIPQ